MTPKATTDGTTVAALRGWNNVREDRSRDGGIVATPTDERRDLLTVIAYMKAAPGKEAELKAALEALIEPTSKEAGYVNYDLHQAVDDPGTFFFYENWESGDDLDQHLSAPHLTHFADIMGGLLDDNGLTITRLRRIA
jgi:quinol monooxygenase YgiN